MREAAGIEIELALDWWQVQVGAACIDALGGQVGCRQWWEEIAQLVEARQQYRARQAHVARGHGGWEEGGGPQRTERRRQQHIPLEAANIRITRGFGKGAEARNSGFKASEAGARVRVLGVAGDQPGYGFAQAAVGGAPYINRTRCPVRCALAFG